MRIGITGHTNLTEGTSEVVYRALVQHLRAFDGAGIVGVTCLADGADQLFACAVQEVGGVYEVVLPAPDYREKLASPRRGDFDRLLAGAHAVIRTGQRRSGVKAYVAANRIMLDRIEHLMAVWDGENRERPGGTAEVVLDARRRGVETTVIWPAGAARQ